MSFSAKASFCRARADISKIELLHETREELVRNNGPVDPPRADIICVFMVHSNIFQKHPAGWSHPFLEENHVHFWGNVFCRPRMDNSPAPLHVERHAVVVFSCFPCGTVEGRAPNCGRPREGHRGRQRPGAYRRDQIRWVDYIQ